MTGGDNKEPVILTVQCAVRCMIEDLLTDEPYKPRLLIHILTCHPGCSSVTDWGL